MASLRASISAAVLSLPLALSLAAGAQRARSHTASPRAATTASPAELDAAMRQAESGHCEAALAPLQRGFARIADREKRLRAGLDGLKCAMTSNQTDTALAFLLPLQHDFPTDPEVLYLATHIYSDLAEQTSRQLILKAPGSYQVHELNAEALEVQGKWEEARAEYEQVLKKDPTLLGIHYRIGRSYLSEPPGSDADQAKRNQAARQEFEAELKLDPTNAGAEFVLGELDRQGGAWASAAPHFQRASQLDPRFVEAFMAWGEAEIHLHKDAEALPPLKRAEAMQPQNPTTHFLLAEAYMHTGDKAGRDAEIALYQQTQRQSRLTRDQIQQQLLAGELPAGAQQ